MEITIREHDCSKDYNGIVPTIKVLENKEYCCPFCSHGETIHFKCDVALKGSFGTRDKYKWYLECCEDCFKIQLSTPFYEMKKEEALEKAVKQFERLIIFTKDINTFINV